ncbi:MAG: hypothetical protein ACRBN8_29170 [Nannocystales bacterium]
MKRLLALLGLCLSVSTGCPDNGPPPLEGEGCLSCHEGIEQAHGPIPGDQCVTCHGGDPSSRSKADAHVAIPSDWAEIRGDGLPVAPEGFIRDFAPDQLDRLDPAYLQFINPGDIRVVDSTCGTCHPDQVRTMPTSIMTTNAGHYYPTLFMAGLQDDRLARHGSYPAVDPDCDPSIPGTVCELETLVPPGPDDVVAAIEQGDIEAAAYDHYLAKNCNTCHHAGFPRNNSPALYRSAGCSGCHVLYGELGVYEGNDPTIARGTPVHPRRHEITRAIPSEQCATCHFQGGRIGLLFRGIREGGFGEDKTPPNASPIQRTLYGHTPGYYFDDEDVTNDVDETPPDLHYAAGMHCADCHVGSDVHGDGRIYSSAKYQVDIGCEDCHGTVRDPVVPNADGTFSTRSGRPLPQLSLQDGQVTLTGIVDGATHPVSQVADLLDDNGDGTPAMHAAMAPDENGWSHTDSLTCDTCHTSYNQQCIGCHVSFDLRLEQVDYQTGERTAGLTRGSRTSYSLDQVLLGQGPDGRVQTVLASQQVQMTAVGAEFFGSADGAYLLGSEQGGKFRERDGFTANLGFAPFFQHTTTAKPRTCDTCHRRDESDAELRRVRGVFGQGTGEFMLQGSEGELVDGLQYVDENGDPTTTWMHPGTGPVPTDAMAAAIAVILEE